MRIAEEIAYCETCGELLEAVRCGCGAWSIGCWHCDTFYHAARGCPTCTGLLSVEVDVGDEYATVRLRCSSCPGHGSFKVRPPGYHAARLESPAPSTSASIIILGTAEQLEAAGMRGVPIARRRKGELS
jgi:hypothetical protein